MTIRPKKLSRIREITWLAASLFFSDSRWGNHLPERSESDLLF